MRKKLMSVVLATALATTMMAGCSGAGSKETSDDGKVTLKLGIWPAEELPEDIKQFEGYKKTMEKEYPDVTVEPAHYTYATDTFVSIASSGNCPTIFETWYTEPQKLIKQGLAADITEELEARGWIDKMSPSVLALMSDDEGHVYGVPRDAYVLGVMCNVALFKEAGLVDSDGVPIFPTTWDELAQTAKTIKDKTGAAGFCLLAKDNSGGWHFSNIAWCFGATLCTANDDGTYTSNLDSTEAIEAMKYVYDLKWKYDVLTADPTAEVWDTGFQNLATGACAMYIGANDAVNQPTQVYKLELENLAMCPIPAGPNGDQWSLTGGTPYMFSKDATKEEINAALDFLTVMGKSPEVNDTAKTGLKADAAKRQQEGVPVLQQFPCWINQEYLDLQDEVVEEYKNVNDKMYETYFNGSNVRAEEPGDAQKMYAELTSVLQAVVTDKNCDIEALMQQADANYQQILDDEFPAK